MPEGGSRASASRASAWAAQACPSFAVSERSSTSIPLSPARSRLITAWVIALQRSNATDHAAAAAEGHHRDTGRGNKPENRR